MVLNAARIKATKDLVIFGWSNIWLNIFVKTFGKALN